MTIDWQQMIDGVNALHSHINGTTPMPDLSWTYIHVDATGEQTLTVTLGVKEEKVRMWIASVPTRDFRKATWTGTPLHVDDAELASVTVLEANEWYHAIFAEVVY